MQQSSKDSIDVLVLDQNPILAEGLSNLLSSGDRLCGKSQQCRNWSDFKLSQDDDTDVIVVDPNQTGLLAADLTARLAPKNNKTFLVGYSSSQSVDLARACFSAGFKAFLPKTAAIDTMRRAILVVAEGGVYLDEVYASAIIGSQGPMSKRRDSAPKLTDRELHVLRLVAHGKTLKEIAAELDLSTKTVDTYKSRGAAKLNLVGRPDIVQYAISSGWMQPQH